MKVPVLTKSDTKKTVEVADRLFSTEVSPALLAQAVRTAQSNRRLSPAHTKTRGEVRGGGRKPWRQKGTGRARVGSTRSPIWRHGGVIFGPTGETNHSLSMPQRMRRQAFLGALTAVYSDGRVTVIPDFSLEKPSTKALIGELAKSEIPTRRTLLVIGEADEAIMRSGDNLPQFEVVSAGYLSTLAILTATRLVFTESGLRATAERYGGEL